MLATAGLPATLRARRGAAKRKLLILLVVVLGMLIFAPTIVLNTPLRTRLLTGIVPPQAAQVNTGSLTVGWLTPLSATNVTLSDPEGNRLAEIGKLSIDRTVIGFMSSSDNLGTIRLEDVTLYAMVSPTGSNLERAIAAWSSPTATQGDQLSGSSSRTEYKLQIENGRLLTRDAATGATWSADAITAVVEHPASGALRIEAAGQVRPAPPELGGPALALQPGAAVGRFELQWGVDTTSGLKRLRVVCQDVAVAAVEPWLKRFDANLQTTGMITGELSASYPREHYDSLSGETSGRIALRQFAITGTALEDEQLALDQTSLAWKCLASGGQVSVENLSLASDLATFDLRGTLDERTVRNVAAGQSKPLALALHGDLEAEGHLDLARLTQRLPQYFQIREGTTINSGQADFTARTMPRQAGNYITASLTTTPLVGTANGRTIEWDTPLDIAVEALHSESGWRFDRLNCQSKFLNITGAGDASHMQLAGQMDLDELSNRLEQFVDLTDWNLAGRGELDATVKRNRSGRFVADANGKLNDFVVAYRGENLVTEPRLDWNLHAVGVAAPESLRPERLDVAELTLTAAGDELEAKLTQPAIIEPLWTATDWPVRLTTTGDLNGWARRVRPWVDLSDWSMAGQLELDATGRFRMNPPMAAVASSAMTVQQLQATSDEWQINEPRVEWSGDIAWDSVTNTLVSRNGQLVSSSVASSFRDWFWTADPRQSSSVAGTAAVRFDLARLARMSRLRSSEPLAHFPGGANERHGQARRPVGSGGGRRRSVRPEHPARETPAGAARRDAHHRYHLAGTPTASCRQTGLRAGKR